MGPSPGRKKKKRAVKITGPGTKRITPKDVRKVITRREKDMARYVKEHPEDVGPFGAMIRLEKLPSLPADLEAVFRNSNFYTLFAVQLIRSGRVEKQRFFEILGDALSKKGKSKEFEELRKSIERELQKK